MPAAQPVPPARQQPGVVSRRILPFAPVALAVAAQALGGGGGGGAPTPSDAQAAVCGDHIAGFEDCHATYPTGCSQKPNYDGYLNYLKNQLFNPDAAPAHYMTVAELAAKEGSLPAALGKANHGQFKDELKTKLGDGEVAGLTGYLYYSKPGGVESSNCKLSGAEDIDFHIGIGPDATLAGKIAGKQNLTTEESRRLKTESVIVEMTPHWRATFRPQWDLDKLKAVAGRQVRLVGQLLADNEHHDTHDDCGLQDHGNACWRASIWELHPVTRFQVCGTGACKPDDAGPDSNWEDLEGPAPEAGQSAPPGGATPPAPPA
jgi:hypothetical protein